MPRPRTTRLAALPMLCLLAACSQGGGFDFDMRRFGSGGFDTSAAVREATANRPAPDARGVLTYPNYQVAVAQRGDTVEAVAARVGVPAADLARFNAIQPGVPLREGEVLALPRGAVAAPVPVAAAPGGAPGAIDVTTIAAGAIDRAEAGGTPAAAAPAAISGPEPVRHRVARGETAYSVARLYGVSVNALAEWNGLGSDLSVREGQYLLIPVTTATPVAAAGAPLDATRPGEGSATPVPPSASQPLPPPPAATPPAPESPQMAAQATRASQLLMPVEGRIIRPYQKRRNEGIDIAAPAGTPVKAAEAGTVAAITRDTEQVPILVIRHADNLLTVYANIDGIKVEKGAKVTRGQTIAEVRAGGTPFLHFEVRQGFDSVDPMPYLQ